MREDNKQKLKELIEERQGIVTKMLQSQRDVEDYNRKLDHLNNQIKRLVESDMED